MQPSGRPRVATSIATIALGANGPRAERRASTNTCRGYLAAPRAGGKQQVRLLLKRR